MASTPKTPANNADKKAKLQKIFLGGCLFVFCLTGFFVGRLIEEYFFEGEYVEGGIKNTTSTYLAVYPNEVSLNFVIDTIKATKYEVLILSQFIQSKDVIDALIAKMKEGVRVTIIMNPKDVHTALASSTSPVHYMHSNGLTDIRIDRVPLSHQTMIIDSKTILIGNGSFSTKAASSSAAAFMLVNSPKEATKLREYFIERYKLSLPIFD